MLNICLETGSIISYYIDIILSVLAPMESGNQHLGLELSVLSFQWILEYGFPLKDPRRESDVTFALYYPSCGAVKRIMKR